MSLAGGTSFKESNLLCSLCRQTALLWSLHQRQAVYCLKRLETPFVCVNGSIKINYCQLLSLLRTPTYMQSELVPTDPVSLTAVLDVCSSVPSGTSVCMQFFYIQTELPESIYLSCILSFVVFTGLCDFEMDTCGWSQETVSDEWDWLRRKGPTPSDNTGPSIDHTTNTDNGKTVVNWA